ncbi:MAG TPA: uroporphyrinogen decarboxylase [Chitinophagaceae bacterium]
MNWVEWLGYFAAGLVVLSFLVGSKVRRIRFINMLGAIAFLIYGILLDFNLPIIIPNAFITCIQFYYLFIKKEPASGKQQ